jgi:uncharacterized protein YkwD
MKRQQLIGITLAGLAGMIPLGAIANRSAIAETSIDLNTLRSIALSQHNTYRRIHRSPDMTLDNGLNNTAQSWAEYLAANAVFEHSSRSQRNNAGENLYVSYTTAPSISADTLGKEAVTNWYNEVSDYNYANPGFSGKTGHFTQVVWKGSTQLGCGAAQGRATLNGTNFNAFYVVCHYAPAGNMMGDFPNNVLQP